jgi:hypothetical protein
VHGEDWYSLTAPSGASLQKSLDWLVPFADGSQVHEEFVHSSIRFDYERRDAGVPGFSGNFDAKNARNVFALAARLDPKYTGIVNKLGGAPSWLDVVWPIV